MRQGSVQAPGHTAQGPARPRRKGPGALAPQAAVLGVVVAGFLLVAFRDPNEAGHYPSCPFLMTTGYYCPGCGMTRLVHALAHGDVTAAFGLNPLLLVLLPVFAHLYVKWTVAAARGVPVRSVLLRRSVAYAFIGLLIVYWVVRNLPFAHVLAP